MHIKSINTKCEAERKLVLDGTAAHTLASYASHCSIAAMEIAALSNTRLLLTKDTNCYNSLSLVYKHILVEGN